MIDTVKTLTEVVAVSSLLHTILPPWEVFGDFPKVQKFYKLFVYIVGYAALNGRSTVYQSISTKNGAQPSPAVTEPPVPVVPDHPVGGD